MSKVVIQINSVEALKTLIGDSPETLLAIREGIANEFAKKNLKPIIAQVLEDKLVHIKQLVNEVFREILEGPIVVENSLLRWSLRGEPKLSDEAKKAIAQTVRVQISLLVQEETQAALGEKSAAIEQLVLDKLSEQILASVKKAVKFGA